MSAPAQGQKVDQAAALRAVASKALATAEHLSTRRLSRCVEALRPDLDKIQDLTGRGIAPGTIARAYKAADELDETYSQETIRVAILTLLGRGRKKKRSSDKASGSRATPKRGSTASVSAQSPHQPAAPPSSRRTQAQPQARPVPVSSRDDRYIEEPEA